MKLLINPIRIACFLLTMAPIMAYAQDFTISWGEERLYSKVRAQQLIGRDKTGFYVLRYQQKDDKVLIVDKYDYQNYAQIQSTKLNLPEIGKKNVQFEKIILLGNNFILLSSHYNSSTDINYAYASLFNLNGEILKDPIELDKIESVENKKNIGYFNFRLTPDSTSLMAFHNTPFSKNSNEKFSIKLFDSQLNEKWRNNFKLPYDDSEFEVTNIVLDNKQNVYMVCAHYGNGWFSTDPAVLKKYSILLYSHTEKKLIDFEINVENKWFHSARFQMVGDTSLVVAGFYSNSSQGNLSGTFYLRFDTNLGELVASGFEPLKREVLTFIGSSGDFSMNSGSDLFALRNLLVRKDGSVVLVAEKEYVNVTSYIDAYTGQQIRNNHYHFDEVLVVGISNTSAVQFAVVLPKLQNSTNDFGPYSSIATYMNKDQLYVLYNDNPANVQSNNDIRELTNFSKSMAVIAKINKQGQITKEPLFRIKDFGAILIPKFSHELYGKRQVIYGEQNGKDKFGEIIYND